MTAEERARRLRERWGLHSYIKGGAVPWTVAELESSFAAEIRAAQAEVWEEAAWKVRSGHDSCSNAELCRAVLADEFERLAAALREGR